MMVALMLVMVGITCLCLFRVYVAFGSRGRRRLRFPKSSQGKIMTSQEFETYRQSKMMHQDELDSESDDSHDEEDVNEADERNLEEEAFLHRQRQQAYVAEQRLNRRKVSGGEGSQTPERRPAVGFSVVLDISVETWISASTSAQSGLEKPEVGHPASLAQEDDDDVPIALLTRRQHTSGGLVSRIESLESPSPWNKRRTDHDPFGAPANPPRFYGRETPALQPNPVMMGGQFMPQQFQGGAYCRCR
ncbi:uncharacterized protein B0I36DRAFT_355828 [Microdochium trichocladiopsis]|uniref:Uncharacterized protein n=1 Tax=Microdochium trichocladiopsis TaxID=1682393 RepID=A0A9P8XSD4_9PEZI|nr:uncharacterized protein B0I36DRAFT_355828 [Microdochium trichocladiopsis]KAH7014645.1 hypothetical protein B0I36DRAFT_355828 [Microdochium trichocladiopsis]